MSIEAARREEEKRCLSKKVNFEINMWRASGDIDYLYKAIAILKAQIKKEEENA